MLKEYLTWVQNSVFEGELTTSQLLEVKKRIKKIIDTQEDSVLIFSNQYSIQKEIIGQEINSTSNII
jgi:CRISPR-associated protein Cas2